MSLPAALAVLYSPSPPEVQFNCPWCTTRLALPQSDFQNERAVLCPRCNNPIDLTVQRRIASQQSAPPPPRQAPTPPAPPPQMRRTVPAPSAASKPPPPSQVQREHRQREEQQQREIRQRQEQQAREQRQRQDQQRDEILKEQQERQTAKAPSTTRSLPPLEKKLRESGALDFDPDKPIDIDAAFRGEPIKVDDIDALMSASDLWGMTPPRGGAATEAASGSPAASAPGADEVVVCPSCQYENAPVPRGFEFGKVRKCTWCGKPLPKVSEKK